MPFRIEGLVSETTLAAICFLGPDCSTDHYGSLNDPRLVLDNIQTAFNHIQADKGNFWGCQTVLVSDVSDGFPQFDDGPTNNPVIVEVCAPVEDTLRIYCPDDAVLLLNVQNAGLQGFQVTTYYGGDCGLPVNVPFRIAHVVDGDCQVSDTCVSLECTSRSATVSMSLGKDICCGTIDDLSNLLCATHDRHPHESAGCRSVTLSEATDQCALGDNLIMNQYLAPTCEEAIDGMLNGYKNCYSKLHGEEVMATTTTSPTTVAVTTYAPTEEEPVSSSSSSTNAPTTSVNKDNDKDVSNDDSETVPPSKDGNNGSGAATAAAMPFPTLRGNRCAGWLTLMLIAVWVVHHAGPHLIL